MICNCKSIKENVLNNAVINSIKDVISKYANKESIVNNLYYKNENKIKESLLQEKTNLKGNINKNNNIKFSLYKDKINNVISQKDYIEFSNKLSKNILSLENRITYINNELEKISANNNKDVILQLVDKVLNVENLTRNDILQLIDKIEIGPHCEQLRIFFKFNTKI